MDTPISRRAILLGSSMSFFIPSASRVADPLAIRLGGAEASGGTVAQGIGSDVPGSGKGAGPVFTPAMFGAVPFIPQKPYIGQDSRPTTGIVDSGVALNRFFAFASALANTGARFDCSGFYGTTVPLLLGPETAAQAGYSARPAITGHMTIVALTEVSAPVLTLRNMDGMAWPGALTLIAGNSNHAYSTKHRWAVRLAGKTTKQVLPKIECHGFIYGVTNISNAGEGHFGEWNYIPVLGAWDCGSHYIAGAPNAGLAATFSGVATKGRNGSVEQSATLTGLSVNLPDWLDEVGSIANGEQNVGVSISGRMYQVVAVNRRANSIEVKPRLPAGVTSGSLVYWFGGAFVEGGADGSLGQIGILTTLFSIGWNSSSIYPSTVIRHTSQFDGSPFMFGRQGRGEVGPQIGGGYVQSPYIEEGAGTYYGILLNSAISSVSLGHGEMIDFSRIAMPAPWDGTAEGDITHEGLKAYRVGNNTWESRSKKFAMSGAYGADVFRIAADQSEVATYDPVDNLTIFLEDYESAQDKLFGKRSRILVCCGTGANKQPTGTITLNATFHGNTVNGVGKASYSSLVRPLVLLITADPATGNFTATELNKPFVAAPPVAAPAGGATIDAEARAAINSLISRLQAAGVVA